MDPITIIVCIAGGAGLFTGGYYVAEKYMDQLRESRLAEMMESLHSLTRVTNDNKDEYDMKLLDKHGG